MESTLYDHHDIVILGDLHLVDTEPRGKGSRAFKDPCFSIDREFVAWLERIDAESKGPLSLVINGDFIDFDLIFHGTDADGETAKRKFDLVLFDHRILFEGICRFLAKEGRRLVLILGNHDLEFLLPEVREHFFRRLSELCTTMGWKERDADGLEDRISFEPWFLFQKGLLYVEHGDRFDRYATSPRPFHLPLQGPSESSSPFGQPLPLRPFLSLGSLANRFILKDLPTFNPFMGDQVIRGLSGYLRHLLGHYLFPPWRLPFLYIRGALRAFRAAMVQRSWEQDHPLTPRENEIAGMGRQWGWINGEMANLWSMGKESVILTSPFRSLHILWIDRIGLFVGFALVLGGAMLCGSSVKLLLGILVAMGILYPTYELLWGRKEVLREKQGFRHHAERIARILSVPYVVLSHTHRPEDLPLRGGARYLNCGSWAPIFEDGGSTRLWSKGKTYVHLRVRQGRPEAGLFQWREEGAVTLGPDEAHVNESDSAW